MRLEKEIRDLLDYYPKQIEILEKQKRWMAEELADVYLSELCSQDDKEANPDYWIKKAEQAICHY